MSVENQGSKESKKVKEGFNNVMTKLVAIVGGEESLSPVKKVKQSEARHLIEDLFKEERVAKELEVKEGLKNLLKSHVLLRKTLSEERAKLDKLEIQKKKEFNKAANELFNKIEGIDILVSEYTTSFNEAKGTEGEDK